MSNEYQGRSRHRSRPGDEHVEGGVGLRVIGYLTGWVAILLTATSFLSRDRSGVAAASIPWRWWCCDRGNGRAPGVLPTHHQSRQYQQRMAHIVGVLIVVPRHGRVAVDHAKPQPKYDADGSAHQMQR